MIRARIAWGLVRMDPVRHLLVLLSVAIGLGFALGTAATLEGSRQSVTAFAARFPLVVGPKVGPVALVLGAVTRLQDLPAGLSPEHLEALRADPRVAQAVPILGGHSAGGIPILATSPALLEPRETFPLDKGRTFQDGKMEAVLGASAASTLGLVPGDSLVIEHAHAGAPEKPGSLLVTGVLAPRHDDADRSIFCPIEAIFESHGHHAAHEEHAAHEHHDSSKASISAILLRPVDHASLMSIQEDLLEEPGLEVALTGPTLRRVVDQLSGGTRLLELVVAGIGAVTFLTLAMGMYGTGRAWTRAVAVLRVMGARRREVLALVGAAAMALVGMGLAGGLLVGVIVAALGARILSSSLGLQADPVFLAPGVGRSLAVYGGVLLISVLIPALSATRREVAAVLRGLGRPEGERSPSRTLLRLLVPALVFVAADLLMTRHESEGFSLPPNDDSLAIYAAMTVWEGKPPLPETLAGLNAQPGEVEGYMLVTGDPYTTEDFYLVSQDPRLPRCPFCYRAPTRWERIRVEGRAGERIDIAGGLVRVSGTFHFEPGTADPCSIDREGFEVVLRR